MKTFEKIIAALLLSVVILCAQNEKQIVDLRGQWKFEIGDQKKFAEPKFDDSKWEEIFVPEVWENEGYPGYDGYAWYRKTFTLPASAQGKNLFFHGGFIDDACQIFINGNRIGGKGFFPPDFETAYDQEEIFIIPEEFLKFNQENVVAIRVFDDYRDGGITRGRVGIYHHADETRLTLRLPVLWKFKTGDDEKWADPSFDDGKWQRLIVPNAWDYQGYEGYDGFAWYRVSFDAPSTLKDEKLFLLLGRIDDVDEAYINGVKIGNTGRMSGARWIDRIQDEYQEERMYRIPASTLKAGQKNVIAVRIYDKMKYGGFIEGTVGIVNESEYKRIMKENETQYRKRTSSFERFMDKIFNE